jgi:hypothetical protein
MFKMLMLVGVIFTGSVFCSVKESSGFSLEEECINEAKQSLMASQMPTTKLEFLKFFWETARAAHHAHETNSAAEVEIQKGILLEKFTEMQGALGDVSSLTLQSMNTLTESFTAYRYYKKAYNVEKKLPKKTSSEES